MNSDWSGVPHVDHLTIFNDPFLDSIGIMAFGLAVFLSIFGTLFFPIIVRFCAYIKRNNHKSSFKKMFISSF